MTEPQEVMVVGGVEVFAAIPELVILAGRYVLGAPPDFVVVAFV